MQVNHWKIWVNICKIFCRYIESKPKHWSPKHSLVVKEIENVDKMKMSLCVQHTMNLQNFPERNNRRSDLILELKRVFENLGIKYHLLPQEVVVTQFNLTNGRMAIPSSWQTKWLEDAFCSSYIYDAFCALWQPHTLNIFLLSRKMS